MKIQGQVFLIYVTMISSSEKNRSICVNDSKKTSYMWRKLQIPRQPKICLFKLKKEKTIVWAKFSSP